MARRSGASDTNRASQPGGSASSHQGGNAAQTSSVLIGDWPTSTEPDEVELAGPRRREGLVDRARCPVAVCPMKQGANRGLQLRLGVAKGFFRDEGVDLALRVVFGGPEIATSSIS